MKKLLLFILLAAGSSVLMAQKYSNEFLAIGVGAKAHALGGSVVASVDDVTAGYWNPAGLAASSLEDGIQIGAMHAEWFAGIGKYDFLGALIPVDNNQRKIGITAIRFGIDGIPNTLSLYEDDGTVNYDNIVEFSAADYAFLLSYAQDLKTKKGKLHVGGNVKVIYRQIGSFANSWGFGLDAGLQYRLPKWSFGVVAKDVTNTFNAWSFSLTDEEEDQLQATGNELPINSVELTKPQFVFGTAFYHDFKDIGLMAEVNGILTTDGQRNTLLQASTFSLSPSLGLELNYKKFIFLRGGINNVQQDREFEREFWTVQPNFGVGLKILKLYIDYAFTDIGDQVNETYSHVISLRLDLRLKKK